MRRMGAELRRLREADGRNQTEVAVAIGRRHTTMVNWERGKTKISKSDLVCLLAELRAPADLGGDLERLRLEANQASGQWSTYGLPECLKPLVSFEEDATAVGTFQPVLIPGLLQTEDYARTTHVEAPYVVSANVVEKWVAARMLRQQRLAGPDPLRLRAIITEAALRLEVGGLRVLKAQLERLLTDAVADNITIQVLPASLAAHAGVATNTTVIHFADPQVDRPLGYYDGPLGGNLISHEGAVADMINILDDLAKSALNENDSVAMIAAILKEIREKGS